MLAAITFWLGSLQIGTLIGIALVFILLKKCAVSGSSLVRAWLMAGSNPIALVESTVNAWNGIDAQGQIADKKECLTLLGEKGYSGFPPSRTGGIKIASKTRLLACPLGCKEKDFSVTGYFHLLQLCRWSPPVFSQAAPEPKIRLPSSKLKGKDHIPTVKLKANERRSEGEKSSMLELAQGAFPSSWLCEVSAVSLVVASILTCLARRIEMNMLLARRHFCTRERPGFVLSAIEQSSTGENCGGRGVRYMPLAPSFPGDLGPWDQWTEFLRPMKTDVKPLLSDRYQAELNSWRGYAMKGIGRRLLTPRMDCLANKLVGIIVGLRKLFTQRAPPSGHEKRDAEAIKQSMPDLVEDWVKVPCQRNLRKEGIKEWMCRGPVAASLCNLLYAEKRLYKNRLLWD
ncbi:hypothetical protein FNV43_RR08326 [Rhamnella rubrinervis]|uniref:Uncharacterized protein n=1 Tax=Rhamnella rubrinervis TaxID=2594499 RepID=A0A8K0MNJ4_9ROSA|nr:hypothetical protein FNV43_RR08326 [Rhamnella rubrinervis]